MKWSEYYEKFYDWSESTQFNRISSISEFDSTEEICEILIELNEKGASKLIRRAIKNDVHFTAQQIVELSEYIDKEPLSLLISNCKDMFSFQQVTDIGNNSMLNFEEIQKTIPNKITFEGTSWDVFYDMFYELSDKQKIDASLKVKDFSISNEVIEVMFNLAELSGSEKFILNAIDSGIKLDSDQITQLIECGNKNLNKRLVFDNLQIVKKAFPWSEIQNIKEYLYDLDYDKYAKYLEPPKPVVKKVKTSFLTKTGSVVLITKILKRLFGGK